MPNDDNKQDSRTQRVRDLLVNLFGVPDANPTAPVQVDPTPAVIVTDEPNGIAVGIVGRDLTPEDQAEALDVFADALAEVVREHLGALGVDVLVRPPAGGHPGIVQYRYPARTGSEMEARYWWGQVAALLPDAERLANECLTLRYTRRMAERHPARTAAHTPAATTRRASAPARGRR